MNGIGVGRLETKGVFESVAHLDLSKLCTGDNIIVDRWAAAKKALAAAAFNRAAEHLAGGSNEPAPGEGGDDEMAKMKGILAITTRVMYLPDRQPNSRL